MTRVERVIRGKRVATAGGLGPASIHIAGGTIGAVEPFDTIPNGIPIIEAGDAVVFPGLVDTHAHVNEPGRTEWEGFATATRAAAAGGVTTLIDMPLNSIPATTSVSALRAKGNAAAGQCAVDVGFLGGLVPGSVAEIPALHSAGVFGFKSFLCDSGVDEFPRISLPDLQRAAPLLAERNALLMVHAELPEALLAAQGNPGSHAAWLASRPAAAETSAVELLIGLAREFGVRVHVVHVSAPETAKLIARARGAGVRISGETCPHYLVFAAEEIPDGATEYKCAPPIRDAASREGLWRSLAHGELGLVVSDHSPAPAAVKRREDGDFFSAWGGIASLQLRLPAVWTAARERGFEPAALLPWLCSAPAALIGLEGRKGAIVPGADADLVLWWPEQEFTVAGSMLRHRHPLTPYLGRRLAGVVEETYLRGELVYSRDTPDPPARGRLLTR